jgi:hypothetical protein
MKKPKATPTGDPENAVSPRDPVFRQIFEEQWRGPERLDMAGMNKREEEEFLLHYGSRKERKALKKLRKARERAEKNK